MRSTTHIGACCLLLFPFLLFAQQTKQSSWQQEVAYTIAVELDDIQHLLRGNETIVYTNNSPNTLTELYMHLWPNAYRNNNTAFAKQQVENKKKDFLYLAEENRGYIDSLNFIADNVMVKWELTQHIDIAKITLNKPLLPGQKITLATSFKVKLPSIVSRMGHQDQLYCITQCYPKPAVYDVNGWNPIPYLDQGEFYSEFGSFEVFITLPKNYVVGATGELQNEDEKLWLLDLSTKKNGGASKETPPSSTTKKTLHYKQNNIHDFAWFADKRFQVEHSEIVLPKSGNKVSTWWFQIDPKRSNISLVDSAVLYYSSMLGEYPYSHASVAVTPLISGAGMEYPMITNITEVNRQVVFHEVGHNWLYGILGSNERMYPWMDESINTYYETRSTQNETMAPYERLSRSNIMQFATAGFRGLETRYQISARKNEDQACFLPSETYTDFNYGAIIYGKAATAMHYLQQYMGAQKFDAMMQAYYEKWKFKHPLPDDFIDHAKQYSGKNLDWFFSGLMTTTDKQDWKLKSIRKTANGYSLRVKNMSDVNAPFAVTALQNNQPVQTIWFDSLPATNKVEFPAGAYNQLRIDAFENTTDLNRNNNSIRTSGLFKTVRPPEFSFLLNTENPYKQQVYYTPIVGANIYNKTMLGMAFYNSVMPAKATEYMIAPMYAFGTKDLAGAAELQHRFMSHGFARSYTPWVKAAQFASDYFTPTTYTKLEGGITAQLAQHHPRTDAHNSLTARVVSISERSRGAAYTLTGANTYAELSFASEQKRLLQPYSYNITYQYISTNNQAHKLTAEATRFLNYDKAKKGFTIRWFGGVFLQSLASSDGRTDFRAGANTGLYDYTFDQSQFGRGENPVTSNSLFAQQLMIGGLQFKELYPLVTSDKWATGLNVETTVPGILPLVLYADIAFINANESYMDGNTGQMVSQYTPKVLYTSGVSLKLMGDVFRINLPIMASPDIVDYFKGNTPGSVSGSKRYTERITFSFNLNKLNPLKAARNFSF
jgi:hypothetical protein